MHACVQCTLVYEWTYTSPCISRASEKHRKLASGQELLCFLHEKGRKENSHGCNNGKKKPPASQPCWESTAPPRGRLTVKAPYDILIQTFRADSSSALSSGSSGRDIHDGTHPRDLFHGPRSLKCSPPMLVRSGLMKTALSTPCPHRSLPRADPKFCGFCSNRWCRKGLKNL